MTSITPAAGSPAGSQASLLVLPPRLSPGVRRGGGIATSGVLIGVDGGATKTVAAVYDLARGRGTRATRTALTVTHYIHEYQHAA